MVLEPNRCIYNAAQFIFCNSISKSPTFKVSKSVETQQKREIIESPSPNHRIFPLSEIKFTNFWWTFHVSRFILKYYQLIEMISHKTTTDWLIVPRSETAVLRSSEFCFKCSEEIEFPSTNYESHHQWWKICISNGCYSDMRHKPAVQSVGQK